uniref:Proton-coupled amino acid transporter 3 n=1 Tax=Anthurium amnicola TaxID=1678845 RepID=A0A1D1YTE2_9ARAE
MGFEKEASSSSHGLPVPAEASSSAPLLPGHPDANRPLSSQPKTFANLFIAIVGAGVLGLPYTFKRTGWLAGSLMVLVVAVLTYHCMMLLVHTRRRLEQDRGFYKISSFGDLGLVVSGPAGKFAVDAMIVLSQAGFCVSYLIFIANTLAHILHPADGDGVGVSVSSLRSGLLGLRPKTVYIWGMFPFQLGLNSVKTLTHLAPLSIFADVVDIGAMGVVMVEDVALFLRRQPALQAFGGFSVVFYGLGVAVYAFEGIGMVLPLESEAADKARFGRTLGVSMSFISLMYALFGLLGYFAFGEDTRDIITTNLGAGLLTQIVQLGLCINLFFTFPLMMNPVHEVVERRFAGKSFSLWLRWAMVLLVTLAALFVPNFADFLSLVGSSVCCVLGFVLPAWFHLRVFKDEMGPGGIAADLGIIALGLVFTVTGTFSSLMEILGVKS